MKKILSIVLTLALALSLSVTAFAGATDPGTGGDTDNTTQDITIQPGTDGNPSPTSGQTNVKYSVAPAYTVTIPPSVTIDGSAVTVSAEGVKIANGQKVVVRLTGINVTDDNPTGDNEFKVALKDDTNKTLNYTVTASGNVSSSASTSTPASNQTITLTDNVVLTVEAGLNNETDTVNGVETSTGASKGSTTLTFALNDTIIYAGEYSGTVTFTMSVVDPDTSDTGTTP